MIERSTAGTEQVSTVGSLPADPPPLSFLDVSSALSPWTNYQYRLVLHNQAGNSTGEAAPTVLRTLDSALVVIISCDASFYRTLGRYHHQTLPAGWSQPTKGGSPGPRLTPGTRAFIVAVGVSLTDTSDGRS